MDESTERAVRRVIVRMYENLSEPLTIDEMARTAMFSKFHFTRLFERVTGLSPRRFHSALRIQRAKELLDATELNVAEISHTVGYASVGTFSSRFARSVGVSPIAYRRCGGFVSEAGRDATEGSTAPRAIVLGSVCATPAGDGPVFLGLFANRLPQGRPVACTLLSRPGLFTLTGIPEGSWYLVAQSLSVRPGSDHSRTGPGRQSVGANGPITVHHNTTILLADVPLRAACILDPPVLPAPVAYAVNGRTGARQPGRRAAPLPGRLVGPTTSRERLADRSRWQRAA
jgi:AraC family transcriptional regulator